METYFIIHCNDDGELRVEQVDNDELTKQFNDPDYYGDNVGFIEELTSTDPQYWKEGFLIIKGKIVKPKHSGIVFE